MKKAKFIIIFMSFSLFFGCKKYLDAKSDKSLEVPSTLTDLQGLLDNNMYMNLGAPSIGETSADNYYLTDNVWNNNLPFQGIKNTYIWGPGILDDVQNYPNDWSHAYDGVYYSNLVLETINTIPKSSDNIVEWNNIQGSALLFRAKHFFDVAVIWSKEYDSTTASQDLGVPLRLSSDFNVVSVRSSLQQTYDQIINDVKTSIPLLPQVPLIVMRPSKAAAYALLAKVCLAMRDYKNAKLYADSCLSINSDLLDYNTLDPAASYPFPRFNKEVIMSFTTSFSYPLYYGLVDSALYSSYDSNDLRKTLFFKDKGNGTFAFKGTYNADFYNFSGFAVDEIFLTRSECEARSGDLPSALADLDSVLVTRWKKGTFVPFTANNQADAVDLILTERRKELIFRELRWMDLKRLNKDTQTASTIKRFLNGQLYQLPPNDLRYARPIPLWVIQQSNVIQNPGY